MPVPMQAILSITESLARSADSDPAGFGVRKCDSGFVFIVVKLRVTAASIQASKSSPIPLDYAHNQSWCRRLGWTLTERADATDTRKSSENTRERTACPAAHGPLFDRRGPKRRQIIDLYWCLAPLPPLLTRRNE